MAKIPGIRKRRFYERKWVVESLAVVPPIVAGAVAAYFNITDPTKRILGWLLVGAVIWLAIASIVKVLNAYSKDKEEKQKQEYEGLLGAIHVLYAAVSQHLNSDKDLRVTIHRVVPPAEKNQAAEELEQLLPYVGGSGGKPGRRFSIRSGIIGKAVREKEAFAFSRQSDDDKDFIQELVRDWAYTEEDARKVSHDRKVWMAIPIFGAKSDVVGVVYLDSNELNFFTEHIQQQAIQACSGIANYIDETY